MCVPGIGLAGNGVERPTTLRIAPQEATPRASQGAVERTDSFDV